MELEPGVWSLEIRETRSVRRHTGTVTPGVALCGIVSQMPPHDMKNCGLGPYIHTTVLGMYDTYSQYSQSPTDDLADS